jgi:hypothetical protein
MREFSKKEYGRRTFNWTPLNPLRVSLISVGLISACVSVVLLFREW